MLALLVAAAVVPALQNAVPVSSPDELCRRDAPRFGGRCRRVIETRRRGARIQVYQLGGEQRLTYLAIETRGGWVTAPEPITQMLAEGHTCQADEGRPSRPRLRVRGDRVVLRIDTRWTMRMTCPEPGEKNLVRERWRTVDLISCRIDGTDCSTVNQRVR